VLKRSTSLLFSSIPARISAARVGVWSVFPVGFVSSWPVLALDSLCLLAASSYGAKRAADFHVRSGCLVKL
jgi:hypothetical protein